MHQEEREAQTLYRELVDRLGPGATVTLEGEGVHWSCAVERAERRAVVHAFGRYEAGVRTPEAYVEFLEGAEERALGRTTVADEALAAVEMWLDGQSVPDLHARFAFVDEERRTLEALRSGALRAAPELANIQSALQHEFSDSHELRFESGDRACVVKRTWEADGPMAIFTWDDTRLFAFEVRDVEFLARAVTRWVRDHALPSTVRTEFPDLELGPLADDYEAGQPIEGEFRESWREMDAFFGEREARLPTGALAFLADLRAKGFDSTLRAGQSMWSLVLSRSRRHGLRHGQRSVVFSFMDDGTLMVNDRVSGRGRVTLPTIALTPEVEASLRRLELEPVD